MTSPSDMNTELAKVETALTEFDKIEAGLAELRKQYADVVFSVETPSGMKDAITARAAIRKPRYAAEEIRKEAKAPILALGRQLDAKAKYITAELLKIEDPIQAQIAAEEHKKEQAVIAENQRKAAITQAIYDLNMIVPGMAGKSSKEIAARILALQEYDLTEWADEFIVEAEKARAGALASLQQLHAGALAQEQAVAAEAKRIADERIDFERRRKELEERERAEKERLKAARLQQEEAERAARAKIEEAERASRATIEAQERQARLAREQADREAKALREAEEARLKAERDKIEAERKAVEEIQRKEREAEEARQRAIEREQRETADTESMIRTLRSRIDGKSSYAGIAKAIDAYLARVQKAA